MPGEAPSVLVLMGVAGSGKTTTGLLLAERLGWPFRDADSFHPPENVEKMSQGVPLTDEDRRPWLAAVASWIDDRLAAGERGVVTCSALKRAYRDVLIGPRRGVGLVYLKGDRHLIGERLRRRQGHFMPPELLDSQFAALEEPGPDEHPIVVPVLLRPRTVTAEILDRLGLA